MCKITIVDTVMGGGKTTWCIDWINSGAEENILYVSPFLDQDARIAAGCAEYRDFRMPENRGKGKLKSLNELFAGQADIASTHELFKHLDDDSRKYIREGKYTLILDEVLDVIQNYKTKRNDIDTLLESHCITIDEDGMVHWNPAKRDWDNQYNEIKELAESHCLMVVNDTVLIWRYPPEIFGLFENVYVLTYLFEASILKNYFDLYNIQYEKKSVRKVADQKYELCDYYAPNISELAKLINLYDGNLNYSWKQKRSALSLNWFQDSSNKKHVSQIKNNIYNYFRNVLRAESETIMWTTFKDYKNKLKGNGYTKGFLAFNCRSTNDYADRYNLAYAINVFMNPEIVHFFRERGIAIDVDLYALAEMLQWIWRSRIRNGEAINLYVVSKRMRELLQRWMNGENMIGQPDCESKAS